MMSTMSERDRSCEERIGGELENRVADISALLAIADEKATPEQLEEFASDRGLEPDEVDDEVIYEAMSELPLAVGKRELWTVLLSTGGPHDEFEVTYDRESDEVERIDYVFKDWFDGARRTLDSQATEAVERFARYVTADFYSGE